MKLKYAATVTYATGVCTGAVIWAASQAEAWDKLLKGFDGGADVQAVQLAAILADTREIK